MINSDKIIGATVPVIEYENLKLKTFKARKVTVDGKAIGEIHADFGKQNNVAVTILKERLKDSEVAQLDEENYLGLEYGVYIKYDLNSMEGMTIDSVLNVIDKEREAL